MNFWEELKKPFLVMAPMEDVTDSAFRDSIATHSKMKGAEYVTMTEFVSADGLVHADVKGQRKLRAKLYFTPKERPIVAQLFTAIPKNMERAALLVSEMGFDGIDINMGCPDRSVEKQGAGAALIQNPELAQELIYAAKRGAVDLPVSVKTRIGYSTNALDMWLPLLLETHPAVVTIHARTRAQLSKVPADWETISQAVKIRDNLRSETLIVGNGDVACVSDARLRASETHADGVMIGRGIFGNPWAMSEYLPTRVEKIQALIEHTKLFEQTFTDIKSFATMKKHFSSYIEGFAGAKELRMLLMNCTNAAAVTGTLQKYLLLQYKEQTDKT